MQGSTDLAAWTERPGDPVVVAQSLETGYELVEFTEPISDHSSTGFYRLVVTLDP